MNTEISMTTMRLNALIIYLNVVCHYKIYSLINIPFMEIIYLFFSRWSRVSGATPV